MRKKRIIVTITHRTDTIDILAKHLEKQRSSFDEWHVWLNSSDDSIIQYLKTLDCRIIQPNLSNPLDKLNNLHLFYKEDSVDPDANYIKLDDDIVWLEPEFIDKLFSYRERHENEYLLVYPNIINNAIISTLHMRFGHIPWNNRCWYGYMDPVGWAYSIFAETLHRFFLDAIKNNSYKNWYFEKWKLDDRELVSINAISWVGRDFSILAPTIVNSDEFWINNYGPSIINKNSVIIGDPICVHYAFGPQRADLDKTDILNEYRNLIISV